MWTVALGMAVFLQAGAARADEAEGAVHVECPADSAGEDCTADEAVVPPPPETPTSPETPPVAAAAPAAVATIPPAATTFATVSFRNDVGKKLRLVEARFTMDGEALPVVLTSAEPGKSYVIGTVKPGPHAVTARLTYRGDRGVFRYMKGYTLNVRSEQVLTAPADRTISFTVVGSENKGLAVPMERSVIVKVENGASRK